MDVVQETETNVMRAPVLPLARYRLRFSHSANLGLPEYTGSMWRGALGHALRKLVCVTRMDACPPCLLYRSCPYTYIFETPPPLNAQKMRKYAAAPHPFLIEPLGEAEEGIHQVGLTLIGRGNACLAYVIHAFQRAGRQGLGKGRAPMELMDVWQACPVETETWTRIYEAGGILNPEPSNAPQIPAPPAAIRMRFETPLRLQHDESLVTPDTFRFSHLFGPLLRRVSMLTYFHTDMPLETDFAGLMDQARRVELALVKLRWKDWTRYSSHQKTEMQMGGMTGEIMVPLSDRSPLWPYLWLGQWVHAGKGTSMGLGRYSIESASLPNECFPGDQPILAP